MLIHMLRMLRLGAVNCYGWIAMMCYDMLCHGMTYICYAMLCYVMLWYDKHIICYHTYVMLCYDKTYAMLCYDMLLQCGNHIRRRTYPPNGKHDSNK